MWQRLSISAFSLLLFCVVGGLCAFAAVHLGGEPGYLVMVVAMLGL